MGNSPFMPRWFPLVVLALGVATPTCSSSVPTYPDRRPGERAPVTRACDDTDRTRCLLPWPSSAFTAVDPSSATGLRLRVERASLPFDDDPSPLAQADGFSRITPIVTGFDRALAPASVGAASPGPLRVLVAQPGSASYGADVPLRYELVGPYADETETLLAAFPEAPLEAATDHVAVVLDSLRAADGSALAPSPDTRVALGLVAPKTDGEARLRAYHAPTRAVLAKAGIDPARVLRVWDFTTRSAEQPSRRLLAVRELALAAVRDGTAIPIIDSVTPGTGSIAFVAKGRLTNVPSFLRADGSPATDASGAPIAAGVREAPFRVVVPHGAGDYPIFMYGHGNGGSVDDDAFDEEIAGVGMAKVNVELTGFQGVAAVSTIVDLKAMFTGSERMAATIVQALASEAAIQRAMGGSLGELLAAPTIAGMPNPAAGRRPRTQRVFAGGGSLGGSLAVVHASADPDVAYTVSNVPGAGWTHFIRTGAAWQMASPLLRVSYPSRLDLELAVLQSQTITDVADSAIWPGLRKGGPPLVLVQESIGDPVVPNPVTELLARALGATHVRTPIAAVRGLVEADEAVGTSGLMQFKTSQTGVLEIHGFAARQTPAGAAARDQIARFLASALAGTPRIERPAACAATADGSCDFSR